MTIQNAVKKLSRVGQVEHSDRGQYWARVGDQVVSFCANGEDRPDARAICFHVQDAGEVADSQTDYFPGSFFRNLTRAIRFATRTA
jgi:hypothetical protein